MPRKRARPSSNCSLAAPAPPFAFSAGSRRAVLSTQSSRQSIPPTTNRAGPGGLVDRQSVRLDRASDRIDPRLRLYPGGSAQLHQCGRPLRVRHLAARLRRASGVHHGRRHLPGRRRDHPPQPALADGRAGTIHACMDAFGTARRRAASAARAGGLRDHTVVLLCPADAADRTHQRHGGRPDVDSARRGGARFCTHRGRHRMAAHRASSRRPQDAAAGDKAAS